MRTFWKSAVVLAVPAICTALAWSQEAHQPEGTTVKLLLLRQKSVQKELGISATVAKKIMAFTDRESEAAGKARDLSKAKRKKLYEQLDELNKQFLAKNLSAKQNKRLDQIYLQVTAPYQLTRAKVAKALKLTEDQQQKFKDLYKEYRKEAGEILFGKDTEGRAEKYAKLREKTGEQILSILTDKQQAQAREAVGAPFKGELEFEEHELRKKK
jgi:hypothetical protein